MGALGRAGGRSKELRQMGVGGRQEGSPAPAELWAGSGGLPWAGGLRGRAAGTPVRHEGEFRERQRWRGSLRSGRRRGRLASPRLRPPCRSFPFPSPGGFCGGGKGIWGSGRRTMLSRLLCAAPSPEGRKRALQRPGRGASVVLPPLLLVVLTACEGTGGRGAGGRRSGAAGGGLRAPIGRPARTADPGIGSGAGLAAGQPGSPARPSGTASRRGAGEFGGERLSE